MTYWLMFKGEEPLKSFELDGLASYFESSWSAIEYLVSSKRIEGGGGGWKVSGNGLTEVVFRGAVMSRGLF